MGCDCRALACRRGGGVARQHIALAVDRHQRIMRRPLLQHSLPAAELLRSGLPLRLHWGRQLGHERSILQHLQPGLTGLSLGLQLRDPFHQRSIVHAKNR